MKKNTIFTKLIQTLLPEEEVSSLTPSVEYEDKARKFRIYQLLQYWIHAALEKWEGFRDGADRAFQSGLPSVNEAVDKQDTVLRHGRLLPIIVNL